MAISKFFSVMAGNKVLKVNGKSGMDILIELA